jgi:hypothetical protein
MLTRATDGYVTATGLETNAAYNDGSADGFFNGYLQTHTSYDPYVSGYAFIKWVQVPSWLSSETRFKNLSEKNFKALSGISSISMETSGVKAGFTGSETSYATSISKTEGFTLKHQEHSGGPLSSLYAEWVSGIRDPKTGIATYAGAKQIPYHSKNHTGTLIYAVTRPDANNLSKGALEKAFIFTNVMPTKIFLDHYNYESGSHDFTEIEQEFKGYMHFGNKVDAIVSSYLQTDGTNPYSFENEDGFGDATSYNSALT